ncbi:MAG: hypothetical protein AAF710_02110 [Planctomycetota bacterium]
MSGVWQAWLIGLLGAAGGWVVLLTTDVLGRRYPLAVYATALSLFVTAAVMWPGSPLFELWFRGRNPIDGLSMVFGVVLLAVGLGVALQAVRNPCRAARSLGAGIGAVLAGAVVGCGIDWAAMAWRDPWHPRADLFRLVTTLLACVGHGVGWLAWAGAVWLCRAREAEWVDRLEPAQRHALDRPRWRVRLMLLGVMTLFAGWAFFEAAAGYSRVFGRGRYTSSFTPYRVGEALNVLLITLLPVVMWGFACVVGRGRWRLPGVCFGCGYDLRGLLGVDGVRVCPECGCRNVIDGGTSPAATHP